MDNITHSLAGALIANGVLLVRGRTSATSGTTPFASTAITTGIIGANLPDSDVAWSALMQASGRYDDISSLLHHRGFTHSLLAAMAWILALWIAASWVHGRRRRGGADRAASSGTGITLLLIATLSVLSHVTLDFTNDYGVHPFSPFVNRWYYGDTSFIIEPWLWVFGAAVLLHLTTRRVMRIGLGAVIALAVGLSWVVPQVSTIPAALVTLGAIGALVALRGSAPARATRFGIVGWMLVTGSFAIGTSAVRSQVLDAADSGPRLATGALPVADGDSVLLLRDVVVSPFPANPLCARVVTVESGPSTYRIMTAWAAAAPRVVTAQWCARAARAELSPGAQHLAMRRVTGADTEAIRWGFHWSAPRAELVTLARASCEVAGWLQFARAPFWARTVGDSIIVGDMRYDRDQGVSVALFTLGATPARCPVAAPWMPPRNDVWPEVAALRRD